MKWPESEALKSRKMRDRIRRPPGVRRVISARSVLC